MTALPTAGRTWVRWAFGAILGGVIGLVVFAFTASPGALSALFSSTESPAMAAATGATDAQPPGESTPQGAESLAVPATESPAAVAAATTLPEAAAANVREQSEQQPTLDSVPDAGVPSKNVALTFKTYPPAHATVHWGAKTLGAILPTKPLVLERPRDSGPLDVVIRARGYLPVHTRAFTFEDNVVGVRITPRSKKDTLFGYRVPLPPLPDGGVVAADDR